MPKRVDHHARRTLIADALMRVAADRGLEAVSLRHVAAEAGVSTGMVQHYFRTKDEMMTFAMETVGERTEARLTAAVEALGESPAPKALVRTLLTGLLPLDEPRRAEGRVALAFLAYSAARPRVAAALREDAAGMREVLAGRIRAAQDAGDAPEELDPDHAATALLALVDGLGVHVLGEHYAPETALAVLDAHLDTVFGPSPH
ncbi:TetR/AcrR family transcriptional regulator [Streptomyces macrosporus]|uniref:TetR/AcrR family transcriptional regulator n=1 Tax=Streptomyces macrosporus TaxID=44032 RepID=A0ABN3JZB4_9ACTN